MAQVPAGGRFVAVAALIALVIGVAFGPTVIRPFASDHLWYLAQLEGDRSLWRGLALMDYSVMREFWTGDLPLFRPLTYAWFAVAHWAWGPDYVAWNVASLVAHGLVVLCAYRLMCRHQSSVGSLLVALLIAVPMPAMEMVVWSNTAGFLWATVCLLIGLTAFTDRRLGAWNVAMTAAVFFAEFCVPVAVFGAVVWRKRPAWLPVLVWSTAYIAHLALISTRVGSLESFGDWVSVDWLARVLPRLGLVSVWWAYLLTVPDVVTLTAAPYDRFVMTVATPWAQGGIGLGLAVALVAIGWGARQQLRTRFTAHGTSILVAAPVLVLLVLCLGRRSSDLMGNSYYLYPCWVLGLVAARALVASEAWTRTRRWLGRVVIAGYVVVHGITAWSTSRDVHVRHAESHAYLQQIHAAVEALPIGQPYVLPIPPPALDPELLLLREDADPVTAPRRTVSEIVFAPRVRRPPTRLPEVAHDQAR
jgi:hypothetical protein